MSYSYEQVSKALETLDKNEREDMLDILLNRVTDIAEARTMIMEIIREFHDEYSLQIGEPCPCPACE